jgi:hypothetical protein
MQERSLQAPAPQTADGFQSRSPKAEERIRLYPYAISMDGMRYRVTLRAQLNKSNPQAHLLTMTEEDFFAVSREGRLIEPGVFISAYARFFGLADSEHSHTIDVFYSAASL